VPVPGVAEKSMPFPDVPMIRLPVDKVTLPGNMIGVAIWLALIILVTAFNTLVLLKVMQ
jgi:hypothetical protein